MQRLPSPSPNGKSIGGNYGSCIIYWRLRTLKDHVTVTGVNVDMQFSWTDDPWRLFYGKQSLKIGCGERTLKIINELNVRDGKLALFGDFPFSEEFPLTFTKV